MRAVLSKAKLDPEDINYINAHGTSTMADVIELAAVERLMGGAAGKVKMSSTKSMTAESCSRSHSELRYSMTWRTTAIFR